MEFLAFRLNVLRGARAVALALLASASLGAMAMTTVTPGAVRNISQFTENQFNSCVAIDPNNSNNVVSFADESGVVYGVVESISTDGGATWISLGEFDPTLSYTALSWDNLGNLSLAAADDTGVN